MHVNSVRNIARSSNGRTTDSESVYLGSNPSLAAMAKKNAKAFFLFAIACENRIRRAEAAKPAAEVPTEAVDAEPWPYSHTVCCEPAKQHTDVTKGRIRLSLLRSKSLDSNGRGSGKEYLPRLGEQVFLFLKGRPSRTVGELSLMGPILMGARVQDLLRTFVSP